MKRNAESLLQMPERTERGREAPPPPLLLRQCIKPPLARLFPAREPTSKNPKRVRTLVAAFRSSVDAVVLHTGAQNGQIDDAAP